MYLKTYLIFAFSSLFLQGFTPSTSAAEPLALQTQNDADVQVIFNTIVSAILKKTPWSDETAIASLSTDSVFKQGYLLGDFSLNSETQGKIETQISTVNDTAKVTTRLTLNSSTPLFFQSLSESLETPIDSLASLKQSILEKIQAIPTQATRKRNLFGQPSGEESSLSDEQKQALLATLDASITVAQTADEEVLTAQMAQIQEVLSSLKETLPQMGWIAQLQQMEIRSSSGQQIMVSAVVESELPKSVIEVYDSYLAQTQNSEQGLSVPRDIVKAIGEKMVRICSSKNYQEDCFDKILKECTRSVARVESCVSQADSIRKAQEAKDNGSTLGVVANGASAVLQEGSQAVGDAIDWAVGDDED